jgi:glutamine amidotransferase-like uncharacterized protein
MTRAAGSYLLWLALLFSLAPLVSAEINVGIYSRMSEVRPEYRKVASAFLADPAMRVVKLRAADIAGGALERVQVLVLTSEPTAQIDLGDVGREKIRQFEAHGGLQIGLGRNGVRRTQERLSAIPGLKQALDRAERKGKDGIPALRIPREIPAAGKKIRVAVYDDGGIGNAEAGLIMQGVLRLDPEMWSTLVGGADIADGVLDQMDAVIFPGGTGSLTAKSLGEAGRQKVREFVARGGAYLGFCAGAYLGTAHYPWSLHLLNVGSANTESWARGGALAEVKVEALGRKLFPELGDATSVFQVYWQGPMMVEGTQKELPGFEVPFRFVSDIYHRAPASKGMTPGKPWMVLSPEASKVRVVLSSGHPESTPGSRYMIPRLVRWMTRREIVSYGEYMNPRKFQAEAMFDKTWKQRRDAAVAVLGTSADVDELERALREAAAGLHGANLYVPGFLRSSHARLRQVAAELIVDAQMFWADRDLEAALVCETDEAARASMEKALRYVQVNR